jgi:hypothetical protein
VGHANCWGEPQPTSLHILRSRETKAVKCAWRAVLWVELNFETAFEVEIGESSHLLGPERRSSMSDRRPPDTSHGHDDVVMHLEVVELSGGGSDLCEQPVQMGAQVLGINERFR